LVRRDDIDLIDVSTPNATHRDIVEAAATEGKHVFCEKPLAVTVAQAEEMLAAVQWAGVKHMVCFNFRFVPAIALAKRFIDEGRLGRVYHFRAVWLQNWLVDCNAPLRWRLRRELAGSGAHGDLNSHFIRFGSVPGGRNRPSGGHVGNLHPGAAGGTRGKTSFTLSRRGGAGGRG